MIRLNLVPESIKQAKKLKQVISLNTRLGFFMIFTTITLSVAFFVAELILQDNYKAMTNQFDLITSNTAAYNKQVRIVNDKIKTISQLQLQTYDWASIIGNISNLIPGGIKISYLQLDHQGDKIKIHGEALTRDDLIKFHDLMLASKIINTFDLPIASMIARDNISFDIDTAINFDALKIANGQSK